MCIHFSSFKCIIHYTCTLYSVQYIVYNVHYIFYIAHCTMKMVYCTMYIVHTRVCIRPLINHTLILITHNISFYRNGLGL